MAGVFGVKADDDGVSDAAGARVHHQQTFDGFCAGYTSAGYGVLFGVAVDGRVGNDPGISVCPAVPVGTFLKPGVFVCVVEATRRFSPCLLK
jgi:hypothetical protein